MKKQITDQSFYKFLKCPSWIAHEMQEEGDIREPLLQKLQDDGLLEEKERFLIGDRPFSEVDLDDVDEAAEKTVELMKQGVETIYKGVLLDGHWVAKPDVLERVEGKSTFGDWYYVAVDIKRSRHLKDEYKFQGVFYAELLKKLQGLKPVRGYVLHANGLVDGFDIDEFQTQFDLALEDIESILEGEKPSHFLTSACKQSPWFLSCREETANCDHLSQMNRVWRSEIRALEEVGITSVSDFANATMADLKRVRNVSMDRLYFLQQQAIAIVEKKVIRMGEADFPEENGVALVIDIESDPLRDLHYLFGVLVVDGEDKQYHAFLAKDPESEKEAWEEFIEFLSGYLGSNIYHYGWYELDVFRKMTEKYGASEDHVHMFEHQMIDVLTRMREKVIFPTPFYSLKDIASHLGFKWRADDASGLNSVLWYQDWLKTGDQSILQQILDYNEDDVLATWIVRCWALDQQK